MSGEILTFPFTRSAAAEAELAALEAVFRVHGARLKSLAYGFLGSEQDAEDAVQDAFLKTHRAQAAFANRSALHTWVYRVLINTCLDERRRRSRRPALSEDAESAAATESPADMRAALRQAIANLDARQRAVFLLSAVEGLPHAEIAAIVETTESNSRTLLLEARRNLKEALR